MDANNRAALECNLYMCNYSWNDVPSAVETHGIFNFIVKISDFWVCWLHPLFEHWKETSSAILSHGFVEQCILQKINTIIFYFSVLWDKRVNIRKD